MFDYYKSLGVLEVTLTSLPDTQPNDLVLTNMFMYRAGNPNVQLWRNEPISVNDCFLKNMNLYSYIVNIDKDEVIVPTNKTGPTWVQMMEVLENVAAKEVNSKNCHSSYSTSFHIMTCLVNRNMGFPELMVSK